MTDNTKPISKSDAIFARAYASAIKSKFEVAIGEIRYILTSPVTLRGMAAGDLVYPQITNFLIYKLADALQHSDNPTFIGASADSYLQQLRSYLEWVKTGTNPSSFIVASMNSARNAAINANKNYSTILTQGQVTWNKVKKSYPDLDFWKWASAHFPTLSEADKTRLAARKDLYAVMEQYFDSKTASTLSHYMDVIDNATNAQTPIIDMNQKGLVNDQALISKAIGIGNSGKQAPENDITQSTVQVPLYTIENYASTVQGWITAAKHNAPRDKIIKIEIHEGKDTTWEDLGFKQVYGGGGGEFWPFLHADVYVNNQWEEHVLKTENWEDAVSLRLAMIDLETFNIQPGKWDIPDIKTQFPDRLPYSPDALGTKFVRVVSILVGYDIELRVQFVSKLRDQVDSIYEQVKSTRGRMSIFGFHVSAGLEGGTTTLDQVETRFEDVKWDKSSGIMTLTPTKNQVYPTILGAVAQRF
ncbi:hypothetical protein D9757_011290 [Collybiopsis confluens]|uniref:Uncharacterized protein n=1 Tax=Collybiopsis confluens TaxID=2823264 RepID=A0A8H5LST9_9AGAR|nr:hypothetical protein D9757_011290 [Collybiopsis confluens]